MLSFPLVAIASPMFPSLQACAKGKGIDKACALSLDKNGYIVDVNSGKKLSDTAEPMGTMNSYALYRDGNRYILDNENYSSAKTKRWVVFGYEDGKVILERIYIFSLDIDMKSGPYWHGYDCRPDARAFAVLADRSFSESAMEALCGDAESEPVRVKDAVSATIPEKSLAVSVPAYTAKLRDGASTYVFSESDEPELSKMVCFSNCLPVAPKQSQTVNAAPLNEVVAQDACKEISASQRLDLCAEIARKAADSKLNASYKNLMARFESQYQVEPEQGKAFMAMTKDSQRAWIKLRDTNCPLEAIEIEPGVAAHVTTVNSCITRMSLERSAYLDKTLPESPVAHPAREERVDLGNVRRVGAGRIGAFVVRHVRTFGDQCLGIQVLAPDASWKVLSFSNVCSFEGKSFNDGYAYVGIEDLKVASDGVHLRLELTPLRSTGEERRQCVIPLRGTEIGELNCAQPSKE